MCNSCLFVFVCVCALQPGRAMQWHEWQHWGEVGADAGSVHSTGGAKVSCDLSHHITCFWITLSIYLSIYLSINPSVNPSIHPSVHPSIHPNFTIMNEIVMVTYRVFLKLNHTTAENVKDFGLWRLCRHWIWSHTVGQAVNSSHFFIIF